MSDYLSVLLPCSEVICLQKSVAAGMFMNAAVYETTEVRPTAPEGDPGTHVYRLLRHQVRCYRLHVREPAACLPHLHSHTHTDWSAYIYLPICLRVVDEP